MSIANVSRTNAQEYSSRDLLNPNLVNRFYQLTHLYPFWLTSAAAAPVVQSGFVKELDSAIYLGLDKSKYHYAQIASETTVADSNALSHLDNVYTDAAITFCKDIYQGAGIDNYLANDEVSGKYSAADNAYILSRLATIKFTPDIDLFIHSLEPNDASYNALKDELALQLQTHVTKHIDELNTSLNFLRWIHHFHFDKYIIVNIPSGTLQYFEKENVVLSMKVVAGKPNSPTPQFSTWCNQVIFYPYWYVPSDIAVKELLPKFKKDPSKMDEMNMELIDSAGNVVDRSTVNWDSLNRGNFHYRFRQATGCSNSLGVIKFNLTDPFDVYMHDTNFKEAFESKAHYISHGCIRLERPVELAKLLLGDRMDEEFVRSCLTSQGPVVNKLSSPIPVFVVYLTAYTDDNNKVVYSKDVYNLQK